MAAPNPVFSKGLNQGLQSLYNANAGDVTFVCGPLNKKVHSLLLGARSPVFEKMCKDHFQEGLNKRIELKEQDPYLAARMLQHLYTIDYPGHKISIGTDEEPSHVSELLTHVKMYAIGDEYDIKDLKDEALWKFEQAMKAKKGHIGELTSLLEVIPAIYTTTPENDRGLRDLVAGFGAQHIERMKDLPELEDVVVQAPKFLFEVLPQYFRRLQDERGTISWHCQRCYTATTWKCSRLVCDRCGGERNLTMGERVVVPK